MTEPHPYVKVAESKAIATYLNDHLAGSAAALDLLAAARGHAHTAVFEGVVDAVTVEIEQDRETLLGIMARVDADAGVVKQTAARVAEKAFRLTASNAVTGNHALSRLLELEALCIGILGKRAGWLALQAANHQALADVDFDRLIGRANDQFARLEPYRLEAATAALASSVADTRGVNDIGPRRDDAIGTL